MLAVAEIFSIAIFFVVILVTAVVFIGWVAVMIVRGIMSGINALLHGPQPRQRISNTIACPTRGCGATNPIDARFCRRCGHGLPAAQRINVRRAAVW